jgi:hypothetical protein
VVGRGTFFRRRFGAVCFAYLKAAPFWSGAVALALGAVATFAFGAVAFAFGATFVFGAVALAFGAALLAAAFGFAVLLGFSTAAMVSSSVRRSSGSARNPTS